MRFNPASNINDALTLSMNWFLYDDDLCHEKVKIWLQ